MRAIAPEDLSPAVLKASYAMGQLVTAGRKAKRFSQAEACKKANISRNTQSEIEKGSPRVQMGHWLAAMEVAGVLQAFGGALPLEGLANMAQAIPRPSRKKR